MTGKSGYVKYLKLFHILIFFGSITLFHGVFFLVFPSPVNAADHWAVLSSSETGAMFMAQADEDFTEEVWDAEDTGFDDDWELAFDQDVAGETNGLPFTWRLETGLRNHIQTDRDLHFREANKKNEVSLRLETTWGATPSYFFAATDAYFFPTFLHEEIGDDHPYSPESKTYRNLRITTRDSELVFREMYVNQDLNRYRIRIGNQLFPWGTADFMNSTAYLNPSDLRELIFRPQDENRFGVPAASAMLFLDAFTAELVFVPFHVPSALPSTGHFWAVKRLDDEYPVIFDEPEELPANSRNFGYGGRATATRSGIDFSFSAYHGPDREQLLVPVSTVVEENQPISVFIAPKSYRVDFIGADLAFTRGDFVFQAEGVFSPNKRGLVRQDTRRPQELTFPYETRRSRYYAYSLGFNYFIPMQRLLANHAGESLLTVEWYQAGYDDEALYRPVVTDFLTLRYQDSFFDDRFKVSLTQLLETRYSGSVWWPRVGYDFKNGFEIELGYVEIHGRKQEGVGRDPLFYYFKNNDFIMVNLRYAFL